jgi:hypothetical protein
MNCCSVCDRLAPAETEAMIKAGWIPSYYSGEEQMLGPVCPECCKKHLRLCRSDGEWETIAGAYRWN